MLKSLLISSELHLCSLLIKEEEGTEIAPLCSFFKAKRANAILSYCKRLKSWSISRDEDSGVPGSYYIEDMLSI